MEIGPMELLIVVALLLTLDVAALRSGADSRHAGTAGADQHRSL